jgi:hypothetical protein
MRDDIEWFNGTIITEEDILRVEQALGVKFPKDYRAFIRTNSCGRPMQDTFDFGNHLGAVLKLLLPFEPEKKINIVHTNDITEGLDKRVIAFADDPFGNSICFDYRNTDTNPPVVFFDHELDSDDPDKYQYICASFTELIDKLYGD